MVGLIDGSVLTDGTVEVVGIALGSSDFVGSSEGPALGSILMLGVEDNDPLDEGSVEIDGSSEGSALKLGSTLMLGSTEGPTDVVGCEL